MFTEAAERGRRHRAAQHGRHPEGAGLGGTGTPMPRGISPGSALPRHGPPRHTPALPGHQTRGSSPALPPHSTRGEAEERPFDGRGRLLST